ncbi:MAG: hypothetical protein HC883_01840 [Bdellovibrionaceae bacterium]|nr:hypothetical protein [Pseudobdellovibrionaceae bacterium]
MRSLIILLTLVMSFSIYAQEENAPAPAAAEDTDALITNIKMRAEAGSKSKYSLAFALGYNTGGLEKPFADKRPNLSGGKGSTDFTSLTGSVSGKYTFDAQKSVFAGLGVRWITPTQSHKPTAYTGDKVDADNPFVRYQYLYRWLGVQASASVSQTFYTASDLQNNGYVTGTSFSQYNAYDFGGSRFSVGFIPYLNLGFFNKDTAAAKSAQSDYSFGVTPFIEYRLTDKINLRSDSNPAAFEHIRSTEDAHTYNRQRVIQTFSVGFALTRDIYISPGVLWVVEDPRDDRSSTWISMNINVF